MATPCVITYKEKKYSYPDFIQLLHDGHLDELVNDGIVNDSKFTGKKNSAVEKEKIKPIKTEKNATTERVITKSDQQQHQNGDESRKTTTTSNSNSDEQSGEVKTQKEEVTQEEASAGKKPAAKQELIDEEDQTEEQKKDHPDAIKKLNDDIELLKGYKESDIASKKFKGVIERAFKMKEEGKISKPTYTKYRNIAQQVLGSKVSVDAEKAKFHIEQLKEDVKKKLLGEGYKKVLMSAPGFGPKQVADLIDLTAMATQKAIDAGYTVKEAIDRAVTHIKKHPFYSRLVEEGHLNEKEFNKAISQNFIKSEEPITEKKEKPKKEEGDIFGETRKKKTVARAEASKEYKDIIDQMDEDEKFYKSINVKKAHEHIDQVLDKLEDKNLLEGLAEKIIKDKHPFHEKIQNLASAKLADRLRTIAQKEGNDMQKSAINKLAAELMVKKNRNTNIAATQTALEAEVAKLMPISEEGLKDFVSASIGDIQNTYLSEEQQKDIASAVNDINSLMQTKEAQQAIREAVEAEIDKIAEATKGKEWASKVNEVIDSLKIDLTDC